MDIYEQINLLTQKVELLEKKIQYDAIKYNNMIKNKENKRKEIEDENKFIKIITDKLLDIKKKCNEKLMEINKEENVECKRYYGKEIYIYIKNIMGIIELLEFILLNINDNDLNKISKILHEKILEKYEFNAYHSLTRFPEEYIDIFWTYYNKINIYIPDNIIVKPLKEEYLRKVLDMTKVINNELVSNNYYSLDIFINYGYDILDSTNIVTVTSSYFKHVNIINFDHYSHPLFIYKNELKNRYENYYKKIHNHLINLPTDLINIIHNYIKPNICSNCGYVHFDIRAIYKLYHINENKCFLVENIKKSINNYRYY